MIADIHNHDALAFDAVANRWPTVRNRSSRHGCITHLKHIVFNFKKVELPSEFLDADWEIRRLNKCLDGFGQGAVLLTRPIHIELRTLAQHRGKKRNPLHMIPMQMTH